MSNKKAIKSSSPFVVTLRRLAKNKVAIIGLIIIVTFTVVAILAPYIMPYPYDQADYSNTFASPSWEHPCGTDDLGRDILSRLMYGGRYSLRIGIFSVGAALLVGATLGAIAGYWGGAIDMVLMRALDIVQSIPGLILSIAVSATLGPGFTNSVIALAVGMTPAYARMTRASVLNIRKMEYLEAATSINASKFRIICKHVLPNAISPLIVQATMGVAQSILVAASLSFIGLGVQPPTPEWGAMLSAGRGYIRKYPHLVLFPGITIMVSVLSLNMIGDALRDALDPKLRD